MRLTNDALPVFIISTANSCRCDYILQHVECIPNAKVVRIVANTYKSIKTNWLNKILQIAAYGRILSLPEIGCATSHQRCYEQILEQGLEYALVLEDDFYINELKAPLLPKLISILSTIVDDFDVISLYSSAYCSSSLEHIDSIDCNLSRTFFISDNTLAYFISNKGAKKILSASASRGSAFLADWPLPLNGLKHFTLDGLGITHLSAVNSSTTNPSVDSEIDGLRRLSKSAPFILNLLAAISLLPLSPRSFGIFFEQRLVRAIMKRLNRILATHS